MMQDLANKVLDTIKNKKINPKPKWEFLLKNYLLWTISLISLSIGSIAFAVIIYMFGNNDWDLYSKLDNSLLEFTLSSLPYLWLLILIIFILLVQYNFKHIRGGYRYKFHLVIIVTILLSIFLGAFLYTLGLGQAIDNILSEKVPAYHRYFNPRMHIWNQVDKGLLSGQVIQKVSPNEFQLIDYNNHLWNIIYTTNLDSASSSVELNSLIRLIGVKIDDNTFQATEIMPWMRHHRQLSPDNRRFMHLMDM